MVFVVLSAEFAYLMANEMCYYEQTPMESTKLSPSIFSELAPMYRCVKITKSNNDPRSKLL